MTRLLLLISLILCCLTQQQQTGTVRTTGTARHNAIISCRAVPGCTTWIEAANETSLTNNTQTQFLKNLGSFAVNADQGTATQRAFYIQNVVNGLPVYRFDHSTDAFGDFYRINANSSNIVNGTTGYTIYSVINMADTGSSSGTSNINSAAIIGDGGTDGWGIAIKAGNFRIFHSSPVAVDAAVAFSINTWYLVEAWYDGANINIDLNGGTVSTTAAAPPVGTGNQIRIGRTNGSANRPNADIPLIETYNRPLSSAERSSVRFGLCQKYAITCS